MSTSTQLMETAKNLVQDAVRAYIASDDDGEISQNSAHQRPLIMVACSGGRDSLALAVVAQQALADVCDVGTIIVNHQLQECSREVADKTAQTCVEHGLHPVRIVDVTVEKTRAGLESDARDARYDALVAVAHEVHARAILIAHTSDDVAETILIKLTRTLRVDDLAGIAPVAVYSGMPCVRPFLSLSRDDTTQLCAQLSLDYWDDPTNGDAVQGELGEDYPLRSRIRHDVIPLLNRVTGRDIRTLFAQGSSQAREDLDIIESATRDAYDKIIREKNGILEIKIRALQAHPRALQRRVIVRAIENCGITPTKAALDAVIELSESIQKKKLIELSSTLRANKLYNVIQLWKDREYANF